MKYYWWGFLSFLIGSQLTIAQEDELSDSTDVVGLNDVVITGQYSAQSVDKSLYQVEVISSEDIKNFAGNTVADVLNQNLNILIVPSADSGDSNAEMLGLNGAYVKVLVDNIPLVGDSGMGNNIDLTKINLDNVERIEIVKGAMGVDYGDNALAGVINIVTKKNIKTDWKISMMVQEETVGKEYDWYENGGISKGKGRHIQALEVGKKINENWFASVGVNRNDFQGFWGEKKGRNYFEQDGFRGYEWLPKEQWNANGIIRYSSKNFSLFYKASYLYEEINFYNEIPRLEVFPNAEQTYYADDRDYFTSRWSHHLNVNAKLFNQVRYNGDFSYQTQERKYEDYVYDIPARNEVSRKSENVFLSTKTFYSRGTFSNLLNRKMIDFQIGYELDHAQGFANSTSALFGFGENIDRELGTYAGFASAEINTNSGISFRPGFRASFNNRFNPQYSYALNLKYDLSSNSNIRAVFGTANRYPDFTELYTYEVNANHDIQGDENLVPENGYSSSIQWNSRTNLGPVKWENNISTIYLDVDDRIQLVNLNPTTADFKFMNIDKFQSWGISTDQKFRWNNFNLNIGASFFGVSQSLLSSSFEVDNFIKDEFRYTFQANASANYSIPNWATTLSIYYKYTGKTTEFVADIENSTPDETVFRLAQREGFSMLDASIRKGFYKNRFEVTIGARNILDVTSIRNTALASPETGNGGHGNSSANMPLFYGRSYFLKLNYLLEF